jgi:hypothetical protein
MATPIPLSVASSDCAAGMYRTQATVAGIETTSGFGGGVRFDLSEGACSVGFDVARRPEDWPSWPWLVQGAQVDISLWSTGGGGVRSGGDQLWFVVRDSITGDPLMSIYQLNRDFIENDQFRDEVGMDVSIVGPVCESSALGEGVLVHAYDLTFSSSEETITLAQSSEGSLRSGNEQLSWQIQTGVLSNTFDHLVSIPIYDLRFGEYFQFVAWPEPR